MTPREAAAECRKRIKHLEGVIGASDLRAGDGQFHYYDGEIDGLRAAAHLIGQINQPQPWPPPEGLRECLAFDKDAQWWIPMSRSPHQDWQEAVRYHVFSHYLPMPEKPEVQG